MISRACEEKRNHLELAELARHRVSDDQQLLIKGAHDLVIETSFLVFAGEVCCT